MEEKGILDGDIKQGFWRKYFENGKMMEEGNYTDNIKPGEWFTYWSNGAIRNKGTYDENQNQIGEWFYHREDGTVQEVKNFSKDEEIYEDVDKEFHEGMDEIS